MELTQYPDDVSVREARELYFQKSGFNAATYTDTWIKLPFYGRHFYLYNFAARRKAVPFHDINHVLTGYGTDWPGEWQISAYELGSGCRKQWGAWVMNSQALIVGVLREPRASLKAFARGRRSLGIYGFPSHEDLLGEKLGALRDKTTMDNEAVRPNWKDTGLFILVVLGAIVVHLGPIVALVAYLAFELTF